MFLLSIDKYFTIDVMIWCNGYNEKFWVFYYIKIDDKTIYYQRSGERILNREKLFYENNKERIREKAKNKYRELSEDEKNIKRESWRNRNQKNSKKVKKGSKYTNKIIVMQKNQNNFFGLFSCIV